jgi:lysophospholipase L1-like esterase
LLASPTATLVAGALVLGFLRCGGEPARPIQGGVVVLGSSTAAGVGASAGHSWVALVQQAARRDCPALPFTNLAASGYTTAQVLPTGTGTGQRPSPDPAHNLTAALALEPALVLLQFPSNDASNRYPLAETLANFAALRDGVRRAGALEVIVGPFPRAFTDPAQVSLMTGLRDALPAVGAPRYLPLWSDLAQSDVLVPAAYASGDGVHLSDAGHGVIAQKVLASAAWREVCKGK